LLILLLDYYSAFFPSLFVMDWSHECVLARINPKLYLRFHNSFPYFSPSSKFPTKSWPLKIELFSRIVRRLLSLTDDIHAAPLFGYSLLFLIGKRAAQQIVLYAFLNQNSKAASHEQKGSQDEIGTGKTVGVGASSSVGRWTVDACLCFGTAMPGKFFPFFTDEFNMNMG
jgi:hypothetical protein